MDNPCPRADFPLPDPNETREEMHWRYIAKHLHAANEAMEAVIHSIAKNSSVHEWGTHVLQHIIRARRFQKCLATHVRKLLEETPRQSPEKNDDDSDLPDTVLWNPDAPTTEQGGAA